jgi:hypothetical protein
VAARAAHAAACFVVLAVPHRRWTRAGGRRRRARGCRRSRASACRPVADECRVGGIPYLGFDIASFAEETTGDARHVGRDRLCLVVAGVAFVAQTWMVAVLSPLTPADLAAAPASQGTAFYDVTRAAIGPWLATVLAVTKAIGPMFAAMTGQAAAARLIFGMARGRLPGQLAEVGDARGCPHGAHRQRGRDTRRERVGGAPARWARRARRSWTSARWAFLLLQMSVVGSSCASAAPATPLPDRAPVARRSSCGCSSRRRSSRSRWRAGSRLASSWLAGGDGSGEFQRPRESGGSLVSPHVPRVVNGTRWHERCMLQVITCPSLVRGGVLLVLVATAPGRVPTWLRNPRPPRTCVLRAPRAAPRLGRRKRRRRACLCGCAAAALDDAAAPAAAAAAMTTRFEAAAAHSLDPAVLLPGVRDRAARGERLAARDVAPRSRPCGMRHLHLGRVDPRRLGLRLRHRPNRTVPDAAADGSAPAMCRPPDALAPPFAVYRALAALAISRARRQTLPRCRR